MYAFHHAIELKCLFDAITTQDDYGMTTDDQDFIEEVLIWIPSLSRFEDDDVMAAVNIVRDAKKRF